MIPAHIRQLSLPPFDPLNQRAAELRPEDPVINDHLGDAYWKVGRKLEATFQWNHARDLDPEPTDLEKIVKKLESGLAADDTGRDG